MGPRMVRDNQYQRRGLMPASDGNSFVSEASERRVLRDPQIRLIQRFFHVGFRISDRVHGGHAIRSPEASVRLRLLRDQAAEQRAEDTGGDRCGESGSENGFHADHRSRCRSTAPSGSAAAEHERVPTASQVFSVAGISH